MQKNFDPDSTLSAKSGIFGLPFTEESAKLILLPVPWEATTSYGGGTSKGPQAILEASPQLDVFDLKWGHFWKPGLYMPKPDKILSTTNSQAKRLVKIAVSAIEKGSLASPKTLRQVDTLGEIVNAWVEEKSTHHLKNNKIVGVVGGDHSSPLGLLRALGKQQKFGILHFDAHADLRQAYQGFRYSHASIMYNVLNEVSSVTSLVGVGYRDFSKPELEMIQSDSRISAFFDRQLKAKLFSGQSWNLLCDEILKPLPKHVYVSFDIDCLEPTNCPSTGTPVPGGLSFDQAIFLLDRLSQSGRSVVGFDLCEVAPGRTEWDANVGARILFELAKTTLTS